jgi:hypothetical protein
MPLPGCSFGRLSRQLPSPVTQPTAAEMHAEVPARLGSPQAGEHDPRRGGGSRRPGRAADVQNGGYQELSRRWLQGRSGYSPAGQATRAVYLYIAALIANVLICRRQGLPDCRGAGIPVRRACRAGPVILAAKLIAGHGAEGERREPRPGRPDAAGARGRAPGWPGRRPSAWRPLGNPGPGRDTSLGSSSGPSLRQMPAPGASRWSRPGAVQVTGAQEDAAA